ncbi:hypothetical protein [Prochlorococcus marinus]|jgi:TRAP-type C4-dicarboxylate transport system permease small subunit|uniref:hypothetical protein n=1 Tax=Prochlorococcus marinus TaxID=1219 RepID=UPI0022B5A5B5|nr:hypothetical protein [Prochlorococcus marinus]
MKSALQLELQDLHGLPYIATIIWFVLLGISLLAVIFYLFQKNSSSKEKVDEISPSKKKSRAKGF